MLAVRSVLTLGAATVALATCDTSIIAHEGDTIGEEVTYEDREFCLH